MRNTGGSAIVIPGTSIIDVDPGQQIAMTCRINFIAHTTNQLQQPLLTDWIIDDWSMAGNDC